MVHKQKSVKRTHARIAQEVEHWVYSPSVDWIYSLSVVSSKPAGENFLLLEIFRYRVGNLLKSILCASEKLDCISLREFLHWSKSVTDRLQSNYMHFLSSRAMKKHFNPNLPHWVDDVAPIVVVVMPVAQSLQALSPSASEYFPVGHLLQVLPGP